MVPWWYQGGSIAVAQLGIEKRESLLPCHALCNPAQNTPTDDHHGYGHDENDND